MGWRFALTSVVGTSHVASGKGCDDASHCEVVLVDGQEEFLIGVVSDGAGSAELSRFGSELVVKVLAENARQWLLSGGQPVALSRETVLDWIDNIRDRISQLAADDFARPKDYAATLIFAIVGATGGAFGQLGDGAVAVSDKTDAWTAVFWPQHGEYANQTYFVTDEAAPDNLAFEVREGAFSDVVMFTDGLERVLLDFTNTRAHPPVFTRMTGPLRRAAGDGEIRALSVQLGEYLMSPSITSSCDDDLTLVMATRRNASASQVTE